MRYCPQCKTEMLEDYSIKVEGGAYGVQVAKGDKFLGGRLEAPKVAICPKCGEVSLYISNLEKI